MEGKYFGGNSPIDFDKIIIGGKTEGDLVVENCATELTVKGANDILIKEAVLILPPSKEPKPDNKPLDQKYPDDSGDFDFLNGANGKVVVELFDDGHFELLIVDGYIELDPFLKEVGDYLASKTSGRPNWILDDLHTNIINRQDEFLNQKEYAVYEISTDEFNFYKGPKQALKLQNTPYEKGDNQTKNVKVDEEVIIDRTIVGMGEIIETRTIQKRYSARIAAILETIAVENARKAEYYARLKRDNIKIEEDDPGGYKAATEKQIKEWVNDLKKPMNPRISIHLDGFNNEGLLKMLDIKSYFKGSPENLDIKIKFDQSIAKGDNSRKMYPITNISSISLPPFVFKSQNMTISGSKITIGETQIKREALYEKDQQVNIKDISVENLNILMQKNEK